MRTVPGFRLFFLILRSIEIFTGRLLWPLLRRRTGRLVVVIPHVPVMVPTPLVLAGRLFLMRFLSHRYQLSFRSGYRKNLSFPVWLPGHSPEYRVPSRISMMRAPSSSTTLSRPGPAVITDLAFSNSPTERTQASPQI